MKEIIAGSAFFGAFISLVFYYIGTRIQRRFRYALCNPLLISILLTILFLKLVRIDYDIYYSSAKYLNWLLTPATVSLAIPLYTQLKLLKDNAKAIMIGILAGVLANLTCILLLALVFGLNHAQYATLLPKSVTTAIGIAMAEIMGGYPSITAVSIAITGIAGNMFAEGYLRLLGVKDRVAKGVAIGTAAHAIGTSRALEMGETEGAMSSLSLVVTGLMTVIGASVFAQFI